MGGERFGSLVRLKCYCLFVVLAHVPFDGKAFRSHELRNGMREKLTMLAAMLAVLCMVALAPALATQF